MMHRSVFEKFISFVYMMRISENYMSISENHEHQ